jgi:hypothetical protein
LLARRRHELFHRLRCCFSPSAAPCLFADHADASCFSALPSFSGGFHAFAIASAYAPFHASAMRAKDARAAMAQPQRQSLQPVRRQSFFHFARCLLFFLLSPFHGFEFSARR